MIEDVKSAVIFGLATVLGGLIGHILFEIIMGVWR
jgi:hypothetical protein